MKNPPISRICTVCRQEKDLNVSNFYKAKHGAYGFQSACKDCKKSHQAAWLSTPEGKATYLKYAKKHRGKPGYNEKHRAYRDTPKAQWNAYLKGAERRGLAFDFTVEEFTEVFWQKPCSYCGDPIRTVGVDRVNNEEGYTKTNAVPCCKMCNFMKLKWNRDVFIAKCVQIAKHSLGL